MHYRFFGDFILSGGVLMWNEGEEVIAWSYRGEEGNFLPSSFIILFSLVLVCGKMFGNYLKRNVTALMKE
jgi:hypothetical protein